ncbi:uncharacterized protein MONBRDRAFT_9313 [Monosiga brevicollis MX1]|uniref:Uncharacterized protein n=1 Tax=Monosiga brevicollis TaxID=81824 RepID=A9V2R4_MONBE|nr:uncharacterized protein MONBRDRAFT_9313 [Monosiga brevicollis MX1]EDQ88057.1 predicted protein [Monosiga brevicollis MX1]|eukprot:XP_001747133.1 hypothetical protein [Monosiga brevicollis MX1]
MTFTHTAWTLKIALVALTAAVAATLGSVLLVRHSATEAVQAFDAHDIRIDATGRDLGVNITLDIPRISALHSADIHALACSSLATNTSTNQTLDLGRLSLSSPLLDVFEGHRYDVQLAFQQDEPGAVAAKLILGSYDRCTITCSADITLRVWHAFPISANWSLGTFDISAKDQARKPNPTHTEPDEPASDLATLQVMADSMRHLNASLPDSLRGLGARTGDPMAVGEVLVVTSFPSTATCTMPIRIQAAPLLKSLLTNFLVHLPATGFVLSAHDASDQPLNVSDVALQGLHGNLLAPQGLDICASALVDVRCANNNCQEALAQTDQFLQLAQNLYANLTLALRTTSWDETSRISFWGRFLSLDHAITVTLPPALVPFRQQVLNAQPSKATPFVLADTDLRQFWASTPAGINAVQPSDVQSSLTADCLDVSFDTRFTQRACAVWNRAAPQDASMRLYGGEAFVKWDDRVFFDAVGGVFWPDVAFERLPGLVSLRFSDNEKLLNTTFVVTYKDNESKVHLTLTNSGPFVANPFEISAGGRLFDIAADTQRLEAQITYHSLGSNNADAVQLLLSGDFPADSVKDLTLNITHAGDPVLHALVTQPDSDSAICLLNITHVVDLIFQGRSNPSTGDRFMNLTASLPEEHVRLVTTARLNSTALELKVDSTGSNQPFGLQAFFASDGHNIHLFAVDDDNDDASVEDDDATAPSYVSINASVTYIDPVHSALLALRVDEARASYYGEAKLNDYAVSVGAAPSGHAPADDDSIGSDDDDIVADDDPGFLSDYYLFWGNYSGQGWLANFSSLVNVDVIDWPMNVIVEAPGATAVHNVALRFANTPTLQVFTSQWSESPSTSRASLACNFQELAAISLTSNVHVCTSAQAKPTFMATSSAIVDASAPLYSASATTDVKTNNHHLVTHSNLTWSQTNQAGWTNVTWDDIVTLVDLSLHDKGRHLTLTANATRKTPGDVWDTHATYHLQQNPQQDVARILANVSWNDHQEQAWLNVNGMEPWTHDTTSKGTLDVNFRTSGGSLGVHNANASLVVVPNATPSANALILWNDMQLNSSMQLASGCASGTLRFNLTRLNHPSVTGRPDASYAFGVLSYADTANFWNAQFAPTDPSGTNNAGTMNVNISWDDHRNSLGARATGFWKDESRDQLAGQLGITMAGPATGSHSVDFYVNHTATSFNLPDLTFASWDALARVDAWRLLVNNASLVMAEGGHRRQYAGAVRVATLDYPDPDARINTRLLDVVLDALWHRVFLGNQSSSALTNNIQLDWNQRQNKLTLATHFNSSFDAALNTSNHLVADDLSSDLIMLWNPENQHVLCNASVATATEGGRLSIAVNNDWTVSGTFQVGDVNATATASLTPGFERALIEADAVRVANGLVAANLFSGRLDHRFCQSFVDVVQCAGLSTPLISSEIEQSWREVVALELYWDDKQEAALISVDVNCSEFMDGTWQLNTSVGSSVADADVKALWNLQFNGEEPYAELLGTTWVNTDVLHTVLTYAENMELPQIVCSGRWNDVQWESELQCAKDWQTGHADLHVTEPNLRPIAPFVNRALGPAGPGRAPLALPLPLWTGVLDYDVRELEAMTASCRLVDAHQHVYNASLNASYTTSASIQRVSASVALHLDEDFVNMTGTGNFDLSQGQLDTHAVGQASGTPFGLTVKIQEDDISGSAVAYWASTEVTARGTLGVAGRSGSFLLASKHDRLKNQPTLIFNATAAYWSESAIGGVFGVNWATAHSCIAGWNGTASFSPSHDIQLGVTENMCGNWAVDPLITTSRPTVDEQLPIPQAHFSETWTAHREGIYLGLIFAGVMSAGVAVFALVFLLQRRKRQVAANVNARAARDVKYLPLNPEVEV